MTTNRLRTVLIATTLFASLGLSGCVVHDRGYYRGHDRHHDGGRDSHRHHDRDGVHRYGDDGRRHDGDRYWH